MGRPRPQDPWRRWRSGTRTGPPHLDLLEKQYIKIAGRDPSPSPRSPAAQGSPRPSVDPPSPPAAQDPSVSPSPSLAASGEPSVSPLPPPPRPAKKKESAWVPPPPPPRPKKTQERKKKEKPAPEKSGYEMTSEELDAWVQEDVRKQLKPKEPVDPGAKKFYLSMMCQPKPALMSDYDRSITKSWEKKSNRRYNQVP